jgi:RimJ/RimL family protein N-acetyltransferase
MVEQADMGIILSWRNDPNARNNSLYTSIIDNATHETWFRERISRIGNEPFFVLELDRPVATCRFDISDNLDKCFDISIIVNPEFQKKGVGRIALSKSCTKIFEMYPDWKIRASVKRTNTASIRLFESTQFTLDSQTKEFLSYSRTKTNKD